MKLSSTEDHRTADILILFSWDLHSPDCLLTKNGLVRLPSIGETQSEYGFLWTLYGRCSPPRIELKYQLFMASYRNNKFFARDLKTAEVLFSYRRRVCAVALDNGLNMGYSQHVHLLCLGKRDELVTFLVGRPLIQTRIVRLCFPKGTFLYRSLLYDEGVQLLVVGDRVFVTGTYIQPYGGCIYEFRIYDKVTPVQRAWLVRIIETPDTVSHIGLLNDGRVFFTDKTFVHVLVG